MNEDSKMRIVIAVFIWCLVITAGVCIYLKWWQPKQEIATQKAKAKEKQEILDNTSSQMTYQHEITINLDAFSGYCILRSREFRDECGRKGIKVNIVDDQANYGDRLKAMDSGKAEMAVFTIDSLIKASATGGSLPSTVVMLIDETKGADAVVAEKKTFPNIDAMNDPAVKVVATADSPSEFMTRVLMFHYNLPQLRPDCFQFVNGAAEVYNAYKASKPGDKKVFVLWEPYVSKLVQNPDYHILIASDKFRGYVVDVLTANRSFLLKKGEVVEAVVKSYLTVMFNNRASMVQLVMDDAKRLGEPLQPEQAKRLVEGIWWKNTSENFGHFSMTSGHGLQRIDEMISNIVEVLLKTKAITADPVGGQYNKWYYDKLMRQLFDSNWHPGFEEEKVRTEVALRVLNEEEWKKLQPVGTLNVARLVFARGTDSLTEMSETVLADLAEKLKSWPQYYLLVKGNAIRSDDPETQKANVELAKQRAEAAVKWLTEHGVDKGRIKSDNGEPNGSSTVSFVLGQVPY